MFLFQCGFRPTHFFNHFKKKLKIMSKLKIIRPQRSRGTLMPTATITKAGVFINRPAAKVMGLKIGMKAIAAASDAKLYITTALKGEAAYKLGGKKVDTDEDGFVKLIMSVSAILADTGLRRGRYKLLHETYEEDGRMWHVFAFLHGMPERKKKEKNSKIVPKHWGVNS